MMDRVEFHNSWLSMERPLTSLSFEAGDWPVCEGSYVEWNLRVYTSPEAECVDRSVKYPDIAGFPYFREWRRACLKDRGTKEEELDLLPEDEFDRDYKIHSNGTCGMSAGFQYAIAERKGKAGE